MAISLDRPYTSLASVQRFLHDIDPRNIDLINDSINLASRYIDSRTDKIYYMKNYTNVPVIMDNGLGGNFCVFPVQDLQQRGFIQCPYRPIVTPPVICVNSGALVEGVDYDVDYENGQISAIKIGWESILFGSNTQTPSADISISVNLGYSNGTGLTDYSEYDATSISSDVPGDIQNYCKLIAATFTGLRKKVAFDKAGGETGSFEYNDRVDKWIEQELMNIRQRG